MIKPYKKIYIENLETIAQSCYSIIEDAGLKRHTDLYYIDKFGEKNKDRFRNLPVLRDLMTSLNLYDYWFSTAIVETYTDLRIHKDTGEFTFSFNIPIQNTKDTYTVFYETIGQPKKMYIPNSYVDYMYYPIEQTTEINRFEMTEAAIINTQIAHNVLHCSKVKPRIVLALRLDGSYIPDEDMTTV